MSLNYLEFIPVYGEKINFEITEQGEVVILQENTGFFNRIAQTLFGKPRVSKIHLDEMGNFIWPLIDGKRNLLDIAEAVKAHFGERAEPLYDRLIQYTKTLESYGFIKLDQSKAKEQAESKRV